MNSMFADVVDFNDIVPDFPLKAQGPFMNLRELKIRIHGAYRTRTERWRLTQTVWCTSWKKGRNDRSKIPKQPVGGALAKCRVGYTNIISRSALEDRRA